MKAGCWAASEREGHSCTDMDSFKTPRQGVTKVVVPQGNHLRKDQMPDREERATKEEERSTPVSEGTGGGAPDTREDIALQKTMVRQAVPLQPMENPHTGAGRHVLNEASTHGETTQQ